MTVTIRAGHVLAELAKMPDRSVHMVWCSPPYWGLRSYGTEPQVWGGDPACDHVWGRMERGKRKDILPADQTTAGRLSMGGGRQSTDNQNGGHFCSRCGAWRGEHGLEPSFDLWLAHEVMIFREVRRVLRDDGTVWINIGDAYATAPAGNKDNGQDPRNGKRDDRTFRVKPFNTSGTPGFKNKDRIMMPARLAIALQEDGWWLRDEIIWHKRNPMPSSVKDRTTPAHEMIYMLSKRARYFYDAAAIMEPCAIDEWDDGSRTFGGANKAGANAKHERTTGRVAEWKPPVGWDEQPGPHGTTHRDGRKNGKRYSFARDGVKMNDIPGQKPQFRPDRDDAGERPLMRNKRSVWSLASEPYHGAHFATAPTNIVRPCILAGTSSRGVCPHCGAPWVRKVVTEYVDRPDCRPGKVRRKDQYADNNGWGGYPDVLAVRSSAGWAPSCKCADNVPVPATVLDPFGGSGTTGLVAEQLGRDAILIELHPGYVRGASARIRHKLGRVDVEGGHHETHTGTLL